MGASVVNSQNLQLHSHPHQIFKPLTSFVRQGSVSTSETSDLMPRIQNFRRQSLIQKIVSRFTKLIKRQDGVATAGIGLLAMIVLFSTVGTIGVSILNQPQQRSPTQPLLIPSSIVLPGKYDLLKHFRFKDITVNPLLEVDLVLF